MNSCFESCNRAACDVYADRINPGVCACSLHTQGLDACLLPAAVRAHEGSLLTCTAACRCLCFTVTGQRNMATCCLGSSCPAANVPEIFRNWCVACVRACVCATASAEAAHAMSHPACN